MKKLVSLLLAAVMVLAMGVTALAADNGTITINNAVSGETYTIYRLLDLESYNTATNAFAYKANSAWKAWLKTQTTYVSVDDQDYVTWVKKDEKGNVIGAEDFAKAAKAYAKENGISPAVAAKTATSATVEFTGLPLGYYLVDTSLGTLCSLNTTIPNVTIEEKNEKPTIEKKVEENSNNSWGDTNDANMKETVNFKTTVTAKKGAASYVVHDVLSAGLTLDKTSISIAGLTKDTDYTVAFDVSCKGKDGETATCDFHITFAQAYLDKLTQDTTIVITYSATLNESAVVGLPGNPNDTKLDYGDGDNGSHSSTEWDTTTTYTWDMSVLKYGNGNETNVLKDAKFVLLNEQKTKVAVFDGGKFQEWKTIPEAVDGVITWPAGAELVTGTDGKIELKGIDAGTYYLRETKAPDGFNKLNTDEEVKITGATKVENTLTYTSVEKKINNNSGTKLPETGSTGTAMFITIGSFLAVAAVVFLITRKKMSIYEN